jgi:predicted nucleic acid-binding protein
MPVVSNTSPLSTLASIGRLELVREQVGSVLIPPAVRMELSRHPHSAARQALEKAIEEQCVRATLDRDATGSTGDNSVSSDGERLSAAHESGANGILCTGGLFKVRTAYHCGNDRVRFIRALVGLYESFSPT